MDLEFSDEQEVLRETVRGLAARHADLSVVRAMEEDPIGYPADFWTKLGESGLTGLTIPEKWGGSEMSMLDAVIVYTELGRALSPSPHFVSSVLSGGVLTAAGTDDQRHQWLVPVASGASVLTTAWLEPDRGYGPKGVALTAHPDGDAWLLTGTKRHVPYANSAARILTLARTGPAPEDITFFLVDPAAIGVTLTPQHTIASDTQHRIDFTATRVPSDAIVGPVNGAWPIWSKVLLDGLILLAAQAVGGARRVLEIAVDYAKTRHQFDKPLGAFQAIAHDLSDAVTAVDGAETLVWEAAWSRDTARSAPRLAPMAKLFACKTFREVSDLAVHIHGGMGFTVECDVQLYFRRAKSLQLNWSDDRHLEDQIATQLLDTA